MGLNRDFEGEGFLHHQRGREFMVIGHGANNVAPLLMLKAVVERVDSDEIITLSVRHGLKLSASFDDAHSDLAMLETIGDLGLVERLALDLEASGYRRLGEQ